MINRELCQLNANRYGDQKAAPSSAWEAGMVAVLGATGLDKAGVDDIPYGIHLTNHMGSFTRAIYGESHGPIDAAEANGVAATVTLDNNNLVASAYAVYAGATLLTENTDYTIDATSGVITAVASGDLDSVNGTYKNNGIITVNYRYNPTAAELNGFLGDLGLVVGGHNFNNGFDGALQSGEVAVAGSGNIIDTDQYATEAAWTVPGVYAYCDANSRLSPVDAGSQKPVGIIVSVPTAQTPWVGIRVL